jgi:hypothetical protein
MTDHLYNETPRSDDNQSLFHPVVIGGRMLPGNLALAPMAGATDGVFRAICKEQGLR